MKWIFGLVMLTGCTAPVTEHLLEEANAKLAQAKAIVAEAEAQRARAEKACGDAVEHLRAVEAIAPFVCGLDVVKANGQAAATCAHAGDLPAAVRNAELACGLVKP